VTIKGVAKALVAKVHRPRRKGDERPPKDAGQRTIVILTVALVVTAIVTNIQTCEALRESRSSFQIAQQPYVSLGRKDGTLAEFVEPKDPKSGQRGGLKIYFQNGGQSPALTPNVGFLMGIILTYQNGKWETPIAVKSIQVFNNLTRSTDNKGGFSESAGSGSIPPQSEYVAFVPELLTEDQLNLMHAGNSTLNFEGEIQYCDEFGHYYCRQFTLFFQGPPIDAFSEINEMNCANMYGYPPRRADQIYLPPCEQPKEREVREKEEQEEIAKKALTAPTIIPTASPSPTP
jgi:hypothetical protein